MAHIGLVREEFINTLAFVVLEFSVDASLTGSAVLGVSAFNAVLDSVRASFAGAILVQEFVSVDALADSIFDLQSWVTGLALYVRCAGQAAERTG